MRALRSTPPHLVKFFLLASLLTGCTTVAKNPYDQPGAGPSPSELAVDACNPIGHLQCIYLTGRETWQDGRAGKFTFHWWRMSYIGRACEKQYGRTTGVILESLFAIPHYTAMALGNAAAALTAPFRREEDDNTEPSDQTRERKASITVMDFLNHPVESTNHEPIAVFARHPAGPVAFFRPGQR